MLNPTFSCWGKLVLSIIRSNGDIESYGNNTISHISTEVKVTNKSELSKLFNTACLTLPSINARNLTTENIQSHNLVRTVEIDLIEKIMNCRVAAIVENYREINLSRSALRGQNNLALRNNLNALTAAGGKNKNKLKVIVTFDLFIIIIIYNNYYYYINIIQFILFLLVIVIIFIVTY